MRGHGRSEKPAPPYAWRNFGEDVAALATKVGISGAIAWAFERRLRGHPRAALEPALFSKLLLWTR